MNSMNSETIQAEYDRLGHQLGWRFMMGPARTLTTASVAVITLNPGGRVYEDAQWSFESGNAYEIEDWRKPSEMGVPAGGKPLQLQVQRMLALAEVKPIDSFSAVFVPFRSPRWMDLPKRQESLEFSRRLWGWALPKLRAKLFLCVGKGVVTRELAALMEATKEEEAECGWKRQTIDIYRNSEQTLLSIPHLSTFKMFGRDETDRLFLDLIQRSWG
jgi:hypothetical protein